MQSTSPSHTGKRKRESGVAAPRESGTTQAHKESIRSQRSRTGKDGNQALPTKKLGESQKSRRDKNGNRTSRDQNHERGPDQDHIASHVRGDKSESGVPDRPTVSKKDERKRTQSAQSTLNLPASTGVLKVFHDDESLLYQDDAPISDVAPAENAKVHDDSVSSISAVEEVGDRDEAPEETTTIGNSDAQNALVQSLAQMAASREVDRRNRRQNHEARMALQSLQSKRARKRQQQREEGEAREATEERDSMAMEDQDDQVDVSGFSMPRFLPQEMLNEHAAKRTQTARGKPADTESEDNTEDVDSTAEEDETSSRKSKPKPEPNLKQVSKMVKFHDDGPSAQDRIVGNTRVRILPPQQASLPPKSNTKTRSLREAWLLGRRGPGPKTWVPRVQQSCGFAR